MLGRRNPHPRLRKRPYEWLWVKLCRRAKNNGKSCDLTYEQFLALVNKKRCAYCGAELPWQAHAHTRTASSASFVDRMDSSKGYTATNSIPCCPVCNKTKSNIFTHEEMLRIGPFIRQILSERKSNGVPH